MDGCLNAIVQSSYIEKSIESYRINTLIDILVYYKPWLSGFVLFYVLYRKIG